MVPDHGSRVEPHRPTLFLQPPAHLDVIASDTELWVEAPYGLQGCFPKRHITSRNVLCLLVGKQDMHRAAWGAAASQGMTRIARRAHVLDLFAGSGAIGIEALSRGATSADFVERDRAALSALRANLERTGLVVGEDYFLCFSPERVDPGNKVWTTRTTPKVIGGMTEACLAAGTAVYSRFIDTMVPVSSTDSAELVKLLENTFRAVNIALVNETAQIADRLGVDVWEVIEAASTKPFGFMKFTPGPGLGGHCIPIDPHYLSWKMRTLDYRTRFIELASEINAEMPRFVVGKVQEALNGARKPVNGSRVLVLGVSYKPNIDDIRESPALDILKDLKRLGADVRYHDPYVPEFFEDGLHLTSVELSDAELEEADLVLLVTDHEAFDLERIFEAAGIMVDSRHATARIARERGVGDPQGWIVKPARS
jgi:hypothetical protein